MDNIEAEIMTTVVCPECGSWLFKNEHGFLFCDSPSCKLYDMQFEPPKITLKRIPNA